MGKASRKRRERMEQVQKAREIEGLVKRARLSDLLIQQVKAAAAEELADIQIRDDYWNTTGNEFPLPSEVSPLAGCDMFISSTLPVIDLSEMEPRIKTPAGLFERPPKLEFQSVGNMPFSEVLIEMRIVDQTWFDADDLVMVSNGIVVYFGCQYDSEESSHTCKSINVACFSIFEGEFEEIGTGVIILNDQGEILDVNTSLFANRYACFIALVYRGLYGVQFLNCRNIVTIDHEPDPADNAAYQRHFGVPMTKYKTLAIKPMGKRYERDDKPQQQFDVIPLHIRRGNFAHYTDDAPLFGKYTGTFWRPATAVGNAKNGIRVKDYEVMGDSVDYSDTVFEASIEESQS